MKFSVSRSSWILGLALLIGGLAAFGVNRYIKRQVDDINERGKATKTVKVVVPKADLPKGTVLAANLVAVREVPAEFAHSNAVTPDQFGRVENQTLAYAAVRGEMLMWSQLVDRSRLPFSSRLVAGRRAITVPVDDINSISGMVEPGDKIDLVMSAKRDNHTYMFPLLQNVTILATGTQAANEPSKDGKQRTFNTVTLDATPEDAQRLLAAREIGKLAAMLRAPGDAGRMATDHRDAMAMLGLGKEVPTNEDSSVPVLYGGAAGRNSKPIAPLRAPASTEAAVGKVPD